MRKCLACDVLKHEHCQDEACGCGVCGTLGRGRWSCSRCASRFPTEADGQAHVDTCTDATLRAG